MMFVPLRALVLLLGLGVAQAPSPVPLRIETSTLPAPVAGAYYDAHLQATGGQPPYKWSLVEGSPPAGVHLEPSGLLVGMPAKPGAFSFTVRLTDSSTPPLTTTRAFKAEAGPPLDVHWLHPPRVENGGIFGAVQVANNLSKQIELTLIIVGVNEFGKSFVLGYQHPTMGPKTVTPEVPFGFNLPPGSYVVHVDAVGEDPATEALYRARRQSASTLKVP